MPLFLLKLLNPATWKAVGVAIVSLLAALLGLNYILRGNKIADQKQEIKELKEVSKVDKQNVEVDTKLVNDKAAIDKAGIDETLKNINDLPK